METKKSLFTLITDYRRHAISLFNSCHAIKLTGLEPNTRYYYQVGVADNGTSEILSFQTKDGNLIFAVSTKTVENECCCKEQQLLSLGHLLVTLAFHGKFRS